MRKISVISGDDRQNYICDFLNQKGFPSSIKNNFSFEENEIVICGTPFQKDNFINCDFYSSYPYQSFLELLKPGQLLFAGSIPSHIHFPKYCQTIDFIKDNYLVWNNAYLTAEGLIGKIICDTPFSLRKKRILVIGFGRCGMNIAHLLKALDCKVFVYDHTENNVNRATAFGYEGISFSDIDAIILKTDIIINTVPVHILGQKELSCINKKCYVYDISSSPFGIDKTDNVSPITCPGIPGIYCPQTAGELIAKTIISYLERNGINDARL